VPDEDADAEPVFRRRKAVCAGYSQLFAAIAAAAGLEAAYVVGEARMEGQGLETTGHAWNAVKLHDRWYLVDTTWDIGGLMGDRIVRRYGTDYLFTPPEAFGLDHFPDDPAWQLRADPIDRGAFLRQPRMRPGFYALGLQLVAPTRSQVTIDRVLEIQIVRPPGVDLMATIGGARCEVAGDRRTAVRCTPPSSGEWEVTLFAGKSGAGTLDGVGEFAVVRP
jgi:transglutaminase/protease-like cytokinesis protein 3